MMLTSSAELRLKQSVEDLADPESGRGEDSSSSGRSTHHHEGALQTQQQPHQQQQRPALEETVDSLLKRLKEKRQALGLPENMLVSERRLLCPPSVYGLFVDALPWRSGCTVYVINVSSTCLSVECLSARVVVCSAWGDWTPSNSIFLLSAGYDTRADGPGEDDPAEVLAVLREPARPPRKTPLPFQACFSTHVMYLLFPLYTYSL